MSIYSNFSFVVEGSGELILETCFSVCVSKAFPKGEKGNLACYIICLSLEGNISSPAKYLFLSIFPDNNADIFAASLLLC